MMAVEIKTQQSTSLLCHLHRYSLMYLPALVASAASSIQLLSRVGLIIVSLVTAFLLRSKFNLLRSKKVR